MKQRVRAGKPKSEEPWEATRPELTSIQRGRLAEELDKHSYDPDRHLCEGCGQPLGSYGVAEEHFQEVAFALGAKGL